MHSTIHYKNDSIYVTKCLLLLLYKSVANYSYVWYAYYSYNNYITYHLLW